MMSGTRQCTCLVPKVFPAWYLARLYIHTVWYSFGAFLVYFLYQCGCRFLKKIQDGSAAAHARHAARRGGLLILLM